MTNEKKESNKIGPARKVVPEENLVEVPYGIPTCRICMLPFDDLREVHKLKFEHGYSYKKIREYLKSKHGIGNDYTYLTRHFKKHAKIDKAMLVGKRHKPIVDILLPTDDMSNKVKTQEDVDRAYSKLVKMTGDFVDIVDFLSDRLKIKFKNRKDLLNQIEKMDHLTYLKVCSEFRRLAGDQIKEVNALRAPKVVVMGFLENFIDKTIIGVNEIIYAMMKEMQVELTIKMRENSGKLDDSVFSNVFKKSAQKYKSGILDLKKDTINKATISLTELQKVY